MNKEKIFETFISQNLNNACRFAYIYVNSQQAAEDIVSESVVKALKSIHQLKDEKFLKTWFFKIITNTAYTYLKRSQKIVYMDDEALEKSFEKYNDSMEENSRVYFENIIKNLRPDYKSIIVLRFFENMKIHEISNILGMNENTIKTRLYRALKILKLEMEEG